MANDFYTRSELTPHTLARASQVNAQLLAIEVGFDRLPSMAALAQGRVTYYEDTGAADVYVVTMDPAISSYVAGLHVSMLIDNLNTGASTLNVNAQGARSIKQGDGTDPGAGDLPADGIAEFRYDGTSFIIISQDLGAAAAAAASAAAALVSENNAASDEASVASLYDQFDDRYLGDKSSNPSVDNDGDALLTGALYWNTDTDDMMVYSGSAWSAVISGAYDAGAVAITGGTIVGITDLAVADGGTGSSTAAGARTALGLGTMAVQAANSVTITGGTITGITDLAIADGGTGSSTAGDARTALGLGTMAVQASGAVSISGGTITGITDLAVADGGTGSSTASDARTALGIGTIATQASDAVTITGGTITGITDLAIADGGTGASTAAAAIAALGGLPVADIASQAEAEAGVENTQYMTSLRTAQAIAALGTNLGDAETEVVTTSGTSKDVTGIPAGTNRITLCFKDLSNDGTSEFTIQIGDSGGLESTGYTANAGTNGGDTTGADYYVITRNNVAADKWNGTVVLNRLGGNKWTCHGSMANGTEGCRIDGGKELSAELTQLRLGSVAADTFDFGAFSVNFE